MHKQIKVVTRRKEYRCGRVPPCSESSSGYQPCWCPPLPPSVCGTLSADLCPTRDNTGMKRKYEVVDSATLPLTLHTMNHCQLPSSSHVHVCCPRPSSPPFPGVSLYGPISISVASLLSFCDWPTSSIEARPRCDESADERRSEMHINKSFPSSSVVEMLCNRSGSSCFKDGPIRSDKPAQKSLVVRFVGPSAFHKSATTSPWRSKYAGRGRLICGSSLLLLVPAGQDPGIGWLPCTSDRFLRAGRKGEIVLKPNSCRPFSSPS
jgi:hypothetical protein